MILAYAAIFGLVQVVCTWVGSHKLFAHLKERDERHERQVNSLLTRIQAPSEAVAADLTQDDPVLLHAVPFDDDDAYWKKRDIEYKDGLGP